MKHVSSRHVIGASAVAALLVVTVLGSLALGQVTTTTADDGTTLGQVTLQQTGEGPAWTVNVEKGLGSSRDDYCVVIGQGSGGGGICAANWSDEKIPAPKTVISPLRVTPTKPDTPLTGAEPQLVVIVADRARDVLVQDPSDPNAEAKNIRSLSGVGATDIEIKANQLTVYTTIVSPRPSDQQKDTAPLEVTYQ